MKIKSIIIVLFLTFIISFALGIWGCGGGVDEEQMEGLNNLKAEVESLRSQLKAKEDEKASLQKQISDKDAKIRKCSDDMTKTKHALEQFEEAMKKIQLIIKSTIAANCLMVDMYFYDLAYKTFPSYVELNDREETLRLGGHLITKDLPWTMTVDRHLYRFIFYDERNMNNVDMEEFDPKLHQNESSVTIQSKLR